MTHPQVISMDDIVKSLKNALLTIAESDMHEETFEFGVDKTRWGLRLTINYRPQGVYLCSDLTTIRTQRTFDHHDAVIVPNDARAGTIEGESLKSVNIFVTSDQFEQFCTEAERVWVLYCREDLCFRGIPDVWFGDFSLVRFIKDYLRPAPAMRLWFEGRISGTPRLLTPPLSD